MMADTELPPRVILSQDETLHQIVLPPLATFLAGLTEARHLLRLHEILEQYRTPTSYHRIDVREVSSSELPFLDIADEETQKDGNAPSRDTQRDEAGNATLEDVARIRGDPIILDAGATPEAQQGGSSGDDPNEAANAPEQDPETLDAGRPSANTAPFDHNTFRASAVPVKSPPRETRATSAAVAEDVTTALPPSGPQRRVRELRLDLRTLDAAALFTLETWRRRELGLPKLDMRVPDSVWYQNEREPTPGVPDTPKRKRGRPRKVVEDQASAVVPPDSTGGDIPDIHDEPIDRAAVDNKQEAAESETGGERGSAGEAGISANAEAGPSTDSRYRLSPSPEELLPDAYNEADEQDSDFVPEDEEKAERAASVQLGPDDQPKKRRGRPPKRSLPADAATPTASPSGTRRPGRPRKSAADAAPTPHLLPEPAQGHADTIRPQESRPSPLEVIAPVLLSSSAASDSVAVLSPDGTGPLPTPHGADRARARLSNRAPTPPGTATGSPAASSRRSSVAVEISTNRPSGQLQRTAAPKRKTQISDDEDEDWGFLKAFT